MMKLLLCNILLACSLYIRSADATTAATSEATAEATSQVPTTRGTEVVTTKAAGTTANVMSTATSGPTPPGANATDETTMTMGKTMTMEQTTMTIDNTTNDSTTKEQTTMAVTTPLVTTLSPPGTYAVNGSDGACILMQFYLKVLIKYEKNNATGGETGEASIVFPDTSVPTGNCSDDSRYFFLTYPGYDDLFLSLEFNVEDKMYEMTTLSLHWKYEEPFFPGAENMGETEDIQLDDPKELDVRADTGKTFACNKRQIEAEPLTVTLEEIKIQPYADQSADKGKFGDEELCSEDRPTNKPQVDNTGMIVGIVLGCVAGVILIIGGVFFCMRHRRARESYKSLD